MRQRPYRLYSVVCNLAIALLAAPVFLFIGMLDINLFMDGFLAITIVAILLGLLHPYRSDNGLLKPRRVLFVFLAVPAALQIFITVWWSFYVSGVFGVFHNMRFASAIRDADRIVVRDGGCGANLDKEPALYVITNKAEIAAFNGMFKFASVHSSCKCCGYPGIDWWKGDKRIALTAIHHGQALRWRGGLPGNVRFTRSSAQRICDWFKEHCGMDINEPALPIHERCRLNRVEISVDIQTWVASNEDKQPSLDTVRESIPEDKQGHFSCPAGGAYSLTYDENGEPEVTCSAPGHKD